MTLVCTPDIGVALPPEGMPYPLLRERAEAACATIDLLLGAGLDPELLIPKPDDKDVATAVVEAFAKDESQASQSLTTNKISTMTPASLLLVRGVLDEFGHAVVEKATHIRHLVTNKLILESDNPDPKVRIRALEFGLAVVPRPALVRINQGGDGRTVFRDELRLLAGVGYAHERLIKVPALFNQEGIGLVRAQIGGVVGTYDVGVTRV
jgi:hypothetical protein